MLSKVFNLEIKTFIFHGLLIKQEIRFNQITHVLLTNCLLLKSHFDVKIVGKDENIVKNIRFSQKGASEQFSNKKLKI